MKQAEISKQFSSIQKQLSITPDNIEQLSELHEFCEEVPAKVNALQTRSVKVASYMDVLDATQFKHPASARGLFEIKSWPKRVYEQLIICNELIEEKKKEYAAEQVDEQARFNQELASLEQEVQSFATYTDIKRVDMAAKHAISVRKKIDDAQNRPQSSTPAKLSLTRTSQSTHRSPALLKSFEPYETLWKTTSSGSN